VTCCADPGCDSFFTERVARRDARRYRRKGLTGTAEQIVRYLVERGVRGRTVLEAGGGIGAVHLELLKAGAERAANVELSPAYEAQAAELLREAGVRDRVERLIADFAQTDGVGPADLVVLDRVVCCYPDYDALVGAAARRTQRTLVMTFPRDAWWTRAFVGAVALVQRLRRQEFRPYVHPTSAIVDAARRQGLELARDSIGPIWQLAAFDRPLSLWGD
jgi:magnesium-protoporphyrin O-methyltransferase